MNCPVRKMTISGLNRPHIGESANCPVSFDND